MLCAPSPNLVFWKVSVQKYKDFSVKKSDKFSSWPLKILSQEFWNPHCQNIFKKSVTVCVAGRGLWLPSQEFGSLIKSLNAAPHVFFLQKWGAQVFGVLNKHCQRHNGPEGWVLLTKVTSLGHITSFYTNLDQTSSESWPCINFKISIRHLHFDKLSNLEILTKPSFRISSKIELHNHNQASAAK